MQRIPQKIRKNNNVSPLLSFLPFAVLISLLQGIINIFSDLHSPILMIDLLFFLFYLAALLINFSDSYPKKAFPNSPDFWKLAGWFLLARSIIFIQIENGEIVATAPLSRKRKLLTIDPASAAAVINPKKELKILKSGFYCLEPQTSLYAIFDLRTQSALFPQDTSDTPSAEMPIGSKRDSPRDIHTYMNATTSDGYHVGAAFWVTFKYDVEFGSGENPYGFDSSQLMKILEKLPTNGRSMGDPQLQARMLIQQTLQSLWQTMVSRSELLDLIPQSTDRSSLLDQIEKDLRKALTTNDPLQNNNLATLDGVNLENAALIMQRHGLRILNLNLYSFWLPPETDLAIQHHWQPHRRKMIDVLQYFNEQKAGIYQELGELHALYDHFHPAEEPSE